MKNTLLVAFDGLDHELIQKFDLEGLKQEQFGKIDNKTGMTATFTSELFASLITGQTYETHGVEGLRKWDNEKVGKAEEIINKVPYAEKFESLRNAIWSSINSLDAQKAKYTKEDLKCDTLFEQVENSRAMFVPSYNPSPFWVIGADLEPIKYGYNQEKTTRHYDTREFDHRKRELFKELENEITGTREFLMCHFHRPDTYQHLYGDKKIGAYDEQKLLRLYKEIEELALEIKQKAEEAGYERIIFMSDHGLPTEEGHNENAFYSSNTELFNKKPKMTDFLPRLKEDE